MIVRKLKAPVGIDLTRRLHSVALPVSLMAGIIQNQPSIPITCPTCAFFASLAGTALIVADKAADTGLALSTLPRVQPKLVADNVVYKVDAATAVKELTVKKQPIQGSVQIPKEVNANTVESLPLRLEAGTAPSVEVPGLSRNTVTTSDERTKAKQASSSKPSYVISAHGLVYYYYYIFL